MYPIVCNSVPGSGISLQPPDTHAIDAKFHGVHRQEAKFHGVHRQVATLEIALYKNV